MDPMGLQRGRHGWATFTFTLKTYCKATVVAFMTLWYWYKHKSYTESPSSSFPGLARQFGVKWVGPRVSDSSRCHFKFISVQLLSHVQFFVTPWTAAHQASVHYQFPELTLTHVHHIGDAIQPRHPLSSPSPPAFSLSQNQGLFQWVSSSHQVAKVLEFRLLWLWAKHLLSPALYFICI